MRTFCRTLIKISKLQTNAFANKSNLLHRAAFSSAPAPIKMAVNVIESENTDANLPPIVIMHGIFGSKQNWRGISRSLESKTKRKIYNVDARNHGESPHVSKHNSAFMAADIKFLMEQENLTRVSVIGHSMGGRTMMYFALHNPELVEKAVIVDVSPISIPINSGVMQDLFSAMINVKVSPDLSLAAGRAIVEPQIKAVVRSKEAVDFIMQNLKKLDTGEFVWSTNVHALRASFPQLRAQKSSHHMPPFKAPVLFIGGRQSNYIDPNDWPKIKQLFPNARLEWLDAGHLVHLEKPAEFIELVVDFLKSKYVVESF